MRARAVEISPTDKAETDWFPLVAAATGGGMILLTILFWVAFWIYVVPHLTMKVGFLLVTLAIGLAFIARGVTLKSGRRTAWGPSCHASYIVTGSFTLLLDALFIAV
jgi:uncharacterized membrane protein